MEASKTGSRRRKLLVLIAALAAFPLCSLVFGGLVHAFPASGPWFNLLLLIASFAISGAATLLLADGIERRFLRQAAR